MKFKADRLKYRVSEYPLIKYVDEKEILVKENNFSIFTFSLDSSKDFSLTVEPIE